MPVNVSQWRMEIGNFNNSISNSLCDHIFYLGKSLMVIAYLFYAVLFKRIVNWTLVSAIFNAFLWTKNNIINIYLGRILYWNILSSFLLSIWYCKCLLRLSGDIELNPGPKPNSCKSFSICHWNLNSITSHNFIKVSLLTAYNSIHKFDIICPSETYLNSETLSNNENLNIPGYNLARADHLSNTKRGGVCIYFEESLPLRLCNVSYLNECTCFETVISNKPFNFISLYRSPSQCSDEFENFVYNLDLTLDALIQKNPFLTVMIGGFNAKFNKWCSTDKTTPEGAKHDDLTSQYGLTQLLKEPTHISDNYRSCIDLIFTSQPNLVVDFGIHPSLHENCYHQIVYSKFDLKIFYPPPYERAVWHYQQANTEFIQRFLESFDEKNAFSNCNSNEQVSVLTKTLLNIMSNFIPNETILVDDRDPPWITRKLKGMILEKNSSQISQKISQTK